ncbi:MAG: caspase family protein [Bradyrhizobium sp.]
MGKIFSACAATLLGIALLTCSMVSARAERRVALVVGNAHYNNPSLILTNPKNDAEDVTAALTAIGFQVIQAIDTNRRDLDLSMAKFARLATDADSALFFYAGHALQYQGRNYLMPTDAEVEDEVSLRYQMMLIDDVRAALDRASGVKIMILDACRNNPVVDSLRRRTSGESRAIGATRGLARIDKTQGMVVAYSTASDQVAADGKGRNSPFTSAFLKRLKEPGLEIEQLFRRVASDVNSETQGRQRPETYVSLLSDYYLNQTDRIAFEAVKDSADVNVLRSFVGKYPASSYVSDAMSRIQILDAALQQRQIQRARQEEAARLVEQQRRAEQEVEQKLIEQRRAEQETAERKASEQRRIEQEAAERKLSEQRRREQEVAERRLAEQRRLEKDVAERRSAEQKAAEAAERVRLESEAAARLARENAAKMAAALTPAAGSAPAASKDQGSTVVANIDRLNLGPSVAGKPAAVGDPTGSPEAAAANSANCDRDRSRLTQMRANPVREEIVRFERELSCERLRPQLVRLRESILPLDTNPVATSADVAKTAPQPAAIATVVASAGAPGGAARQPATPALPDLTPPKAPVRTSIAPLNEARACELDSERLARLRAKNPSPTELVEFERELICEKLRPQIVRLRESLPPGDNVAVAGQSRASLPAAQTRVDAGSNAPKIRMAPALPPASCEQERERLAQFRAGAPPRDDVVRFEQEMSCEALRPQVMRLRESLPGG